MPQWSLQLVNFWKLLKIGRLLNESLERYYSWTRINGINEPRIIVAFHSPYTTTTDDSVNLEPYYGFAHGRFWLSCFFVEQSTKK